MERGSERGDDGIERDGNVGIDFIRDERIFVLTKARSGSDYIERARSGGSREGELIPRELNYDEDGEQTTHEPIRGATTIVREEREDVIDLAGDFLPALRVHAYNDSTNLRNREDIWNRNGMDVHIRNNNKDNSTLRSCISA